MGSHCLSSTYEPRDLLEGLLAKATPIVIKNPNIQRESIFQEKTCVPARSGIRLKIYEVVLSECCEEAPERYAIFRPFFTWLENVCRGTINDCQVGEHIVIADT